MNRYLDLSLEEIHSLLVDKKITPVDLVKESLARIEENKDLNAFITINDKAVEEASNLGEVDKDNLFFGIPIAIKDNIMTKDLRTTCASKMLSDFLPIYDATVIKKIKDAKMIIVGKTNMDEFAMGSTSRTSYFGAPKNPVDKTLIAGGSSGGSAACVASNETFLALGSDTGGSVRQPSSFCGTVGLKPTYGLVSRYGLVAFASSLDQIGTITKDVEDNAMLLNVIAGHDAKDSTSVNVEKKDYTKALINDVKGLKIGIPKEYFGEGINPEVKEAVMNVAKKYEELGATVEECSISVTDYALATYYIIACAEASSNLGRFDGIRYGYRTENFSNLKDIYRNSRSEGFGSEVKRRIILGTYVLSSGYYDAYYKKAQKVRTIVKQAFKDLFKKYDVLLTPTAPTVAFDIGTRSNNPLEMYLADICTVSINIGGVPAMSVPCGLDREGMPIGFQLIGNHFDEETLYRAAYTYEQNTDFKSNKPTFKK